MEPTPTPPADPTPRRSDWIVLLWLLVGILPTPVSLVAIMATAKKPADPQGQLFVGLLLFAVVCSFLAAFALASGSSRKAWARGLIACAIGVSLFVLNVVISFFAGCLLMISHSTY